MVSRATFPAVGFNPFGDPVAAPPPPPPPWDALPRDVKTLILLFAARHATRDYAALASVSRVREERGREEK